MFSDSDWLFFVGALMTAGFLAGVLVLVVVPWLWRLLKPLLLPLLT